MWNIKMILFVGFCGAAQLGKHPWNRLTVLLRSETGSFSACARIPQSLSCVHDIQKHAKIY